MGLTNSTEYCGREAQEFYSVALLTGNTASQVRVLANVKNSIKVPSLDFGSDLFQEADCVFNDSGSATLDQNILTVCPVKINIEVCTRTIEDTFLADTLRPGSNTGEVMPATLEDYFLLQMKKKINAEFESLMWNGDSALSPASVCDGWLKKFAADATVVDVSGGTLAANNIIAEIGKVYAAVPNTIANDPDLVIFISPAAAKFYKQAQAALTGNTSAGYDTDKVLSYIGIPLIVAPGMPTNDMVACKKSNLWIGTDLISDFDNVQIIDMSKTLGQDTIRFKMGIKLGFSYGVGAEIVYYT